MKFRKLYYLIAEEKSSFEDKIKDFVGGDPEQVDASDKESKQNIFAAIFKDGDDYLKILMNRDSGDVTVHVKTNGKTAKQKFPDTDTARKTVRKISGSKLQISYRQASQKESAKGNDDE